MRYTWIAFVLACASDTGAKAINYSPGIEIIDPISPVQVLEGESVYFLGKVEDRNHSYEQLEIQWYLGEEVMCPWRTADEDGLSECIIDITWEDREVSATVRDPQSAGGFARVELEVFLRDIPFAEIVEPLPGSFYYQNEVVPLTGVVQDGEDAAETLDATWNSDIEGVLNVESEPDSTGSFSTATFLSEGEHVLQLIVVDSDGKRSSDTVNFQVGPPNSNPTCSITAPSEGAASVFGALANFMGEVDDVDIGPSTLSVEWNSSRDGILSTTLPDTSGNVLFTHHGLSRGEHEITMTVRDERGAECSDSITHIVGTPPSINVQSPGDGDLYLEGDIVNFGATILDSEEAASGLQIEWSSDRDGVLHTDAPNSAGASSFSEVLSPGWHIVRLTATDSVGLYSEDTVSVLVNQRPATPTVEIAPNQPSTLTSLSAIVDNLVDLDGEVPTVSYSWYENGVQTLYSGATIPASELQKGETWRVEVIASDSYLSSDIAFDEVTVLNTAPQIHSLSISPNSGIDNQSALVCSASASDVDEMVSVSYIWTNIPSGDVLGTSDQLQLDETMVSPGEQVLCTAQTIDSDGAVDAASVAVFVENREPVLNGVHVHPTSVATQDSLSCDIDAVDPDSHTLQYSYRWSVNGQVVSTDSDITLDPSWIQPLDTITCEGAAKDPYGGEVSGTASASVVDSPMSYDGLEIVPPEGVNNTGKLTCLLTATDPDEEAISKSYLWRNMTTGQMLGVSNPLQLDSSIAKAGDVIRCTGNAVDIHGNFYTQDVTSTVLNIAPSLDSIVISPNTGVVTASTLLCQAAYTDGDGEVLNIDYSWKNINTGADLGSGDTLTLSPYNTSPQDPISCQAIVEDQGGERASAATTVEVENQLPEASWSEITPSQGYVDDAFSAYGFATDADNDAVTLTYRWYVNNSLYAVGTDTIGPGFSRGTKIVLEVTPNDGYDDGIALESSPLFVRNSKPGSAQVALAPLQPVETQDDLVCKITKGAADADGDVIDYTFQWYVDGTVWTGATSNTAYLGDTIPGSETRGWEIWRCEATPTDGSATGNATLSNTVEIRIICDPELGPNLTTQGIDFSCIGESGFLMGSTSSEVGRDTDEDLHPVGLNQDFFISKHEITQLQFETVLGYNPSQWTACGGDCPVEGVHWHQAAAFANELSFQQGEEQCYSCEGSGEDVVCDVVVEPYVCTGYRLPTEAEWEYAARADASHAFWTSNGGGSLNSGNEENCSTAAMLSDGTLMVELMWFCANHPTNSNPRTSPVGSLSANGFLLHDMHGNVMEWTHDWYQANLGNSAVLNPSGPATGSQKVVKGGYWFSLPEELRAASRRPFHEYYQASTSGIIGFRVAKTYIDD